MENKVLPTQYIATAWLRLCIFYEFLCFYSRNGLLGGLIQEPHKYAPHHSFVPSYFYSASSSPLLLRVAPDSARILCWSFTPKRRRQLRVKDLPKVLTWRLERDSNPRPFGRKATNLPMSHQ